ncbi:snurportin-1 [Belonocnema kinseyi]|uniref:snurportin-1 n=1 Tax=Belonocnema kinseyi TaxID=2817044 RepID=UPI00143E0954|nr:snurportin-1 [Belonocnema kinseyi]XP_033211825.1 snurportin-1 [Belonocnema kinseyi]
MNGSTERQNANSRYLLYKKPISKDNYKLEIDYEESPQESRRHEFLNQQKKNREAAFNSNRGILGEDYNSEEEDDMEIDVDKGKKNFAKYHRRYYDNYLMLSEWMLEVPQDLTENWLVVPCPKGRRTLLVARKGKTKAYARRGKRLATFSSALPGGSNGEYKSSCSIIDCIWVAEEKTYYVLDVLAWASQPFVNCDAEFRFFWLKSKLDQKEFQEKNLQSNNFPILALPRVPCNSDLCSFLESLPPLPLDGILFYHRQAHYTHGRTPLVTWLKPFMLPEVLGISVPSSMDEKPNGYIDMRHFVNRNKTKKIMDDLMESTNESL